MRGFTFVELVVVLVVVGALAVFAMPRLVSQSAFDLAGFQQEVASGLRYGQKYAFAAGCPVRATITSGGFALHHSSSCDAGDFSALLPHPTQGGGYTVPAPSGITLSPAGTFSFLGTGEASTTVTITLTSSAGARQVSIIGPTGYVDTGS
ncbi:MAG: GspH/FimT family pseudopilin [Gammaproteobacteria bacterium]